MFYLITIKVGRGRYYLAVKGYKNTFTANVAKA